MCGGLSPQKSPHGRKEYFIRGDEKLLAILLAKSQYLANSIPNRPQILLLILLAIAS